MADDNNHPPVAVYDNVSLFQRTDVVDNVLTRGTDDSDPDGDELLVTQIAIGGTIKPVTTGGTLIKGAFGSLTIYDDGYFDYSADVEGRIPVGEQVIDRYKYTISDGHGGTAATGLFVNVFGSDQGNSGDNTFLLFGVGKQAAGHQGDDTYSVDQADDRVIEKVGEGTDTVKATVTYTLEAKQEIENLTTTFDKDNPAINLTGNEFSQTIIGNAGSNILSGMGGADTLQGLGGTDTLIGGLGADTFVYKTLFDSTKVANLGRDYIKDFSHAQGDHIDLHFLDANSTVSGDQAFTFIGAAAFGHHAGELRAVNSGVGTVVYGDVDGDAVADFEIGTNKTTFVAGDFVL